MQNNNTGQQAIVQGVQALRQGQTLHAAGRHAEAAAAYNRALALIPKHPQLIADFARLALEVEDWKNAEMLYRRLGALRPDSKIEGPLGQALFEQKRYADAIPWLEKLVTGEPENIDGLYALGNCLYSTGRWEEGLARMRAVHALAPNGKVVGAIMNGLFNLGRRDELDRLADEAIARFPDSRDVRSMYALHKLKAGDYAAGWRHLADVRWRYRPEWQKGSATIATPWDGKPFDGTLLVGAEQGLGDEIMLSSLFDALAAMHRPTLIECAERLLPLFRRSFPDLEFAPRKQGRPDEFRSRNETTGCRQINGLELGLFLRNERNPFPAGRHAWLRPDPTRSDALRAAYRARWPGRKIVGISWKSRRLLAGAADKSFDLTDFVPLLERDDCVFLSLQYGDVQSEIDALNGNRTVLHVDATVDASHDLDGLAAQIAALDAVVSVSNTTVHLAGALGTPCFVLLPRVRPVLWYWGYDGEQTPWYPSLRLLRNTRDDDRSELMRATANALANLPESR